MTNWPGIVSLLFCGICLKHYAYHNMSRRTQLTTKFVFQLMAQLSENFIFIYLGLSVVTESGLEFKPLFILVAVAGICVARYCAVFPLSLIINWVIRYRAQRKGRETAEELPKNHQMMLFWAGLRGAVGVALAAGLTGPNGFALRATVLVVVILTVIIFGGTTARMLEILEIRIGVTEEIDSDDEFDIENVSHYNGYGRPKYNLRAEDDFSDSTSLGNVRGPGRMSGVYSNRADYSTGAHNKRDKRAESSMERRNSTRNLSVKDAGASERGGLLSPDDSRSPTDDGLDLDLPPSAPRPSNWTVAGDGETSPYPTSGSALPAAAVDPRAGISARSAFNQLLHSNGEDAATMFSRLDENFIKPHLLLDPGAGRGNGPSGQG